MGFLQNLHRLEGHFSEQLDEELKQKYPFRITFSLSPVMTLFSTILDPENPTHAARFWLAIPTLSHFETKYVDLKSYPNDFDTLATSNNSHGYHH